MRIFLVCSILLAARLVSAQFAPQTTGNAQSKGQCSPAVTGDHNAITLVGCGIGELQGRQIVELLKEVLAGQTVEQRDMKIEAVRRFASFSDSEMDALIHRAGPFYGNLHVTTGEGGTGILDTNPCNHTMLGVDVKAGKNGNGIKLAPNGPCLDKQSMVEERTKGRRISSADEDGLIHYLSPKAGKIEIVFAEGDLESFKFALDWYKVFIDAGWQTVGNGPLPRTIERSPLSGVSAHLPGSGNCIPPNDDTVAGLAMFAISKRTGTIYVQCSTPTEGDLLTVFIGPKTYSDPPTK